MRNNAFAKINNIFGEKNTRKLNTQNSICEYTRFAMMHTNYKLLYTCRDILY